MAMLQDEAAAYPPLVHYERRILGLKGDPCDVCFSAARKTATGRAAKLAEHPIADLRAGLCGGAALQSFRLVLVATSGRSNNRRKAALGRRRVVSDSSRW